MDINNLEKQYILQGMRVSFCPSDGGDTLFTMSLRRSDVVTTGEQRTIISDEKLRYAYDRYTEKAQVTIPFDDLAISNDGITIRHVIGECGSSFKDHGYARIYCSTSGSSLKPIQIRSGSNVQHALFPLYADWKITEVAVDWTAQGGTSIAISNVIQDDINEIHRVGICEIQGIADLSSRHEKFIDAIEAALQKSRTTSTGPVFYREVKKPTD